MAGRKSNKSNVTNSEIINVDALSYDDEFLEQCKKWISFYREYPFRFCSDYLGINLKPFQCVLLYQMFHNTNFCFIASRGIGKLTFK